MATKKAPAKRKAPAKSRKPTTSKPEPGSVEEYESRAKITVYRDDEWPVEIQTKDWPIVKDKLINGSESGQGGTTCYLCLREHKDGRILLYGYTFQNLSNDPGSPEPHQRNLQDGVLFPAEVAKHKANIASTILNLGSNLHLPKVVARSFVASLPPQKLR